MTQILMILMMSLAPAKAEMKTQINEELSAYTQACKVTITRTYDTGGVQLFCTSESKKLVENHETLKFHSMRLANSNGDVHDELESMRAAVISKLESQGFIPKCSPTNILVYDNDAAHGTTRVNYQIKIPVVTERVCTFSR